MLSELFLNAVQASSLGAATDDFKVQRGSEVIASASLTATITSAGADFTAPTGAFFFRITNSMHTGMGDTSGGGSQGARQWMAYISAESSTSVTFTRYNSTNDDRIDWELVEYIGSVGGANEIEVDRFDQAFAWNEATLNVAIDAGFTIGDTALIVTGQAYSSSGASQMGSALFTIVRNGTGSCTATRGVANTSSGHVSGVAVHFKGSNWSVDEYSTALTSQTTNKTITSRTLANAFTIHSYRFTDSSSVDQDCSIKCTMTTATNLQLYSTDATVTGKTVVSYVVHNASVSVTRYAATMAGTGEEEVDNKTITAVADIGKTMLMMTNDDSGTSALPPRGAINYTLTTTTNVLLKQSDSGNSSDYALEVIELP